MSATPATLALDAAGVSYETIEYDVPPDGSFGDAVVASLGIEPAATGKTLVAAADDQFVVAVVAVDTRLDLKALARAAGAKKARLSEPADAERVTGFVVGGIAPLGHQRRLELFVDEALVAHGTVHVSGGRRGLELTLSAGDLLEVTGATVAPLAAPAARESR
ncbi:MAG: YbaK/EbsC family protein [Acidimicrobiales bacterium]|nr:YbaK/EbsC family protein [Acidimicrobiales bacterium]